MNATKSLNMSFKQNPSPVLGHETNPYETFKSDFPKLYKKWISIRQTPERMGSIWKEVKKLIQIIINDPFLRTIMDNLIHVKFISHFLPDEVTVSTDYNLSHSIRIRNPSGIKIQTALDKMKAIYDTSMRISRHCDA